MKQLIKKFDKKTEQQELKRLKRINKYLKEKSDIVVYILEKDYFTPWPREWFKLCQKDPKCDTWIYIGEFD